MRQVFTSLRVETVEGVVKLLEAADIEVYLANGRSYHSKRSGQFSYAEPMQLKQQSSVWVRHAEDQPRAREILRNAGLLATTRPAQGDSLVFAGTATVEEPRKRPLAWRIRIALLIAIAIAALVTVLRPSPVQAPAPPAVPVSPVPPAAQPATAADPATSPETDDTVRVRIPAPDPAKP